MSWYVDEAGGIASVGFSLTLLMDDSEERGPNVRIGFGVLVRRMMISGQLTIIDGSAAFGSHCAASSSFHSEQKIG